MNRRAFLQGLFALAAQGTIAVPSMTPLRRYWAMGWAPTKTFSPFTAVTFTAAGTETYAYSFEFSEGEGLWLAT